MKIRSLAGVAVAALMGIGLSAPSGAASPGNVPAGLYSPAKSSIASAVDSVHVNRKQPIWLRGAAPNAGGAALLSALDKAALDGLASGPELARRIRSALSLAASGDPAAVASADRLMSNAFVMYVQAIQSPAADMSYADSWAAPHNASPAQQLARAAAAADLAGEVRRMTSVNPVYDMLRDAAFSTSGGDLGQVDPRVVKTLARARINPFQKRYLLVDAAGANLYMIENGRIADTMRVIVGKPSSKTPLIGSTIYYATINPYWNVPADLVQSLIAPRVVEQGVAYLDERNYEVFEDYSAGAAAVDPRKVDWKAVAAGQLQVKLRQKPGPANSMGTVKFGFPNAEDIYLHDTPNKPLFAEDQRNISNGCIRLADAPRLARWLLGRDLPQNGGAPEQHVLLPTPVPVYVTYMTAQPVNGTIAFNADIYGHDRSGSAGVASLR